MGGAELVDDRTQMRADLERRVARMWADGERGVEYRLHGPPGAGKTYTIAKRLIPRASEVFGRERVMLVSMTRAAAAQLATRAGLEPEQVSTFHGLCRRLRSAPKIAGNASAIERFNRWLIETRPGDAPVHSLSAPITNSGDPADDTDGAASGRVRASETTGDKLAGQVNLLRHRLIPKDRWTPLQREWFASWDEWCSETGFGDFTSWIESGLEATYPPAISGTGIVPEVVILDEAQDSSPLELEVLRRWSRSIGGIVLCGDAQQAIYTFRGADPRAFLTPKIPDDQNLALKQSYRLPRRVLEYSATWVAKLPEEERFEVDLLPRRDQAGAEIEGSVILDREITSKNPGRVLAHVDEAERDGQSIAILASCARHLVPIASMLRDRGVMFGCPWRPAEGAWHSTRGWAGVRALLRPLASNVDPELDPCWTWDDVRRITEMISSSSDVYRRGLKANVQRKAKEDAEAMSEVIGGEVLGGRPIEADALRAAIGSGLMDLLINAAASFDEATMIADLIPHATSKAVERLSRAARVADRYGNLKVDPWRAFEWDTMDGRDEPRVMLGTTHASKGAEADRVILFPDLTATYRREALVKRRRTRLIADVPEHGRSDEIRRVYVGMTRARSKLILAGYDSSNRDALDFPDPAALFAATSSCPKGGDYEQAE